MSACGYEQTSGVISSSVRSPLESGPAYREISKLRVLVRLPLRSGPRAITPPMSGSDPRHIRVVLRHVNFVYIHRYLDGNGRMDCVPMNIMLAADGYPWRVITLDKRDGYMARLEQASVGQNIVLFADFRACLVEDGLKGDPQANVRVEMEGRSQGQSRSGGEARQKDWEAPGQ